MANVGNIHAQVVLDTNNFINGMKSVTDNTLKAKESFKRLGDDGKKNFESLIDSTKRHGSSINEIKDRIDRLNQLTSKSKFGSDRFEKLYSELVKSKQALKEVQDALKNTNSGFEKIGVTAQSVIQSLGQLAIGGAIVNGFKSVIQIGMEFTSQLSRIQAVTGSTSAQMRVLSEEAARLGATTKYTAGEAASAMVELGKAGLNTNQILKATNNTLILAQAGELGLAQAASIAADTMAQFNLPAEEMGRIADSLANGANNATISVNDLSESLKYVGGIANSQKISLEQTTAAIAILGNAGIKGSMAGTGLSNVIKDLAAPTAGARKALNQLAIQTTDLDGKLRPLSDIMQDFKDKLGGLGEAKQLDLLKTIFGEVGAPSALALIKAGSDGIDKMTESISKQGKAAEIASAQNDNLQGDLASLNSATEGVSNQMFKAFEPAIRGVIQAITSFVQGVNAWIVKYPDFSKTFIVVASSIALITAGLIGTAGLVSAIKTLQLGMLAANTANLIFGNTLTSLAMSAPAKWLMILGPLALLAAGVTALVYTITIRTREERERVELNEQLSQESTSAGRATRSSLSGNQVQFETDRINAISEALNRMNNIYNSTGNLTNGNTEAINRYRNEQTQTLNIISQMSNAHIRAALSTMVFSDNVGSAISNLNSYRNGFISTQSSANNASISINNATSAVGSLNRILLMTDFDSFVAKAREAGDKVSASFSTQIGSKSLSDIRFWLDEIEKEYGVKIKSVLSQKPGEEKKVDIDIEINNSSIVNSQAKAKELRVRIQELFNSPLSVDKLFSEIEKTEKRINKTDFMAGINSSVLDLIRKLDFLTKKENESEDNWTKISYGIETAKEVAGQLANAMTGLLQSMSKLASVKFQNFQQQLNFFTSGASKFLDDQFAYTEKINDDLIQSEKNKLEALQKERDEAEKIRLQKLKESNSLIDAENNKLLNKEINRLRAEYQAKINNVYETSFNQEQALIQESLMWEEFEQAKIQLTENYANLSEEQKRANEEKSIANRDATNANYLSKEKALTDAIKAMEDEKERRRFEQEKKKDDLRRVSAYVEWQAGKRSFEANKLAQKAQIMGSMGMLAMLIAQGIAMSFAQGGPPGAVIGAIIGTGLSAIGLVAAATSLAAISAQQYPPPPIFASGGMIGGQPHSMGGTLIEAEKGEFVVNKYDTARNIDLLNDINNGGSGNKNVTLNNSFTINGINDPEAITEYVSERITEKLLTASASI